MAWITSSGTEKQQRRRASKRAPAAEPDSPLRVARIRRGLTQTELARLAGLHRNSIRKMENGITREVTPENAAALASVLKIPADELGVRVRASGEAPSIRLRQLTLEQRKIVDELLSLPPEDYALIRVAIEKIRRSRKKGRSRGARR